MSAPNSAADAARLITTHRWAAMATIGPDGPAASMVAYAFEPDLRGLVLFLSRLSAHTRNLINDARVALVVSEDDPWTGDAQTLARVSLTGTARHFERTDPEFAPLWRIYEARLPDATPRLALGDFSIFRVVIESARYVGGFARAATIPADRLSAAVVELE
jgi:putative heme iron utilization protein